MVSRFRVVGKGGTAEGKHGCYLVAQDARCKIRDASRVTHIVSESNAVRHSSQKVTHGTLHKSKTCVAMQKKAVLCYCKAGWLCRHGVGRMYDVCGGIDGRATRQSPMIEWRRGVGCEVGLVTMFKMVGGRGYIRFLIL